MAIACCRGNLGAGKGRATHPCTEHSLRSGFVEGHATVGDADVTQIARNDDRKTIRRQAVGPRTALRLSQDTRNHRRREAEIADLDVLHLLFGELWPNDVERSAELHLLPVAEHSREWPKHGGAAEIL